MAKILVLYHCPPGPVETLAGAIADGARAAGAGVDVAPTATTRVG